DLRRHLALKLRRAVEYPEAQRAISVDVPRIVAWPSAAPSAVRIARGANSGTGTDVLMQLLRLGVRQRGLRGRGRGDPDDHQKREDVPHGGRCYALHLAEQQLAGVEHGHARDVVLVD